MKIYGVIIKIMRFNCVLFTKFSVEKEKTMEINLEGKGSMESCPWGNFPTLARRR